MYGFQDENYSKLKRIDQTQLKENSNKSKSTHEYGNLMIKDYLVFF